MDNPPTTDNETVGSGLDAVVKRAFLNTNEDDYFKFNFNLPECGLSLRSATFVDGVPELWFDAHPKVPTITDGDVATLFRLVSEGKRPGFYYTALPLSNPLHVSRMYTLYDPPWLRWTPVGKLLAEVDWLMKCFHVGTRSNDDKTAFEAWSKTSQLTGLATRLDFPKDGSGPTIMSCDSATVEKSEDDREIRFPEQPKMKITDNCSSLYTKYATQIYDSVAYYDEPKFLKMQEIVKLILVVEWLYKEKGVRVSREWMMKHTSKPTGEVDSTDRPNKPPYDMIPKPTEFLRPTSDVTAKTREAGMYDFLKNEAGVQRRYGFYDFGNAESIMFKEDGTPCPPQKCLKLGFEREFATEVAMLPIALTMTEWQYVSITDKSLESAISDFKAKLLENVQPSDSRREIVQPLPMVVDTKVEDISTTDSVTVKVIEKVCPCAPLALPPVTFTTTMRAAVDNYNMLYAGEDPNEPLKLGIPGIPEVIIPDVNSWEEFISEMTVPTPRIWQEPYVGIGEPSAWGGVTTSSFPVNERRVSSRERDRVVEEDGVYRRAGQKLGVRAEHVRAQGSIQRLAPGSAEFSAVCTQFSGRWVPEKGPCPPVDYIYKVTNAILKREWDSYGRRVQVKTIEQYFHGTRLACNITRNDQLCSKGDCGICGICSAGLDQRCISAGSFQRFGSGFYLAPNSSKCHDYTRISNGYTYRAMLLCDVYPGRKFEFQRNKQHLSGPPQGYDSVYGQVGEDLNYPELVVYDKAAVMPRYIIVYRK